MTTLDKTVGQIAAELPASIGVFEKFQIDFCCGGDRPFAKACRARGLAPEAVAAEIEAAVRMGADAPLRDWTRARLSELLDHILKTHHACLRTELPVIKQRLVKILEAHAATHGESLRRLQQTFFELEKEIHGHLHKDELILLPFLRQIEAARLKGRVPAPAPFAAVENPIRVMRHEHDNAVAARQRMREITFDYRVPPDACATYEALYRGLEKLEADLRQHIHLENNILSPRAVALEAGRSAASGG